MKEHKAARRYLLNAAKSLRDNEIEKAQNFLIKARSNIIYNYSTLMKK